MSEIYNFNTDRPNFGYSRLQTGKKQARLRKLRKGGMNVIGLPEIKHRITLPALEPVNYWFKSISSNQKKNRRRQTGKNQADARKFVSDLRDKVMWARPEV